MLDKPGPVFFCLGIHGQYLIVHPADEFVLAKVSSRARALEANDEVAVSYTHLTLPTKRIV